METGPAASLSNTHVPFSFSAVSVVGHGRWRNGEKKKKEKELLATHSKLLNTWIENFDSRNIFSSREYMFLEKLKERERRRLRGGGSV